MSNKHIHNAIILITLFVLLAILTGLYSIYLGVPTFWDILNYHFYNPFAALEGRYVIDVAPAQFQSFFNPTVDYPLFVLVNLLNDHPWMVAFLIGASHGINLLLISLLAWFLFEPVRHISTIQKVLLCVFALLIGATGSGSTPLIGVWNGDLQASSLILAALVSFIYANGQAQPYPHLAFKLFGLSGFLAGVAVGLKLTMAPYAIGLATSLLLSSARSRTILLFGGAGLAGALAAGGFHHFTMWRLFGNPFFPMFNDIWESPYAAAISYRDDRWLPKTWGDWLFRPIDWVLNLGLTPVAELPFRDIRIALVICLGILAALAWFTSWRIGHTETGNPGLRSFTVFMLVSYALWLSLFSIYRYLLPLELVSGVAIILSMGLMLKPNAWLVAAAGTASLCIVTTIPLEWGHLPFSKRYIEVSGPKLAPDTLVVIVGQDAVSYFIPFFDRNIRWLSVKNNFLSPEQDNLLIQRARQQIKFHRGRLMVLDAGASDAEIFSAMSNFSLCRGTGNCEPVWSNLSPKRYRLCPSKLRASGMRCDLISAKTTRKQEALPGVKLSIEPGMVRMCESNIIAHVSWDVTAAGRRGVKVFVSESEGGTQKLFATGMAQGSQNTDRWVNTGTEFILKDADTGQELAKFLIGSQECD